MNNNFYTNLVPLRAVKMDNGIKAKQKTYWDKRLKSIEQTNDLNPLLDHKIDLDRVKSIDKYITTRLTISGELYHNLKSLTQSEGSEQFS